ncbi:MAG TPA: PP2C family protein-serine/threonine phosphatase [Flavobacteriales bacterium]|nr:PP2C family protein-serine/threonine phosphatase [Flavobacteriales bacterium]
METATETRNFFILYKPKDIVSGDFYYALAHKPQNHPHELFFLCTADCTGHGVPGALMSMMGISCLNESIIERNFFHPGEVLDDVRKSIITSLNPEGSEEESKDGMDCALCVYDFDNMNLEIALANNPLWLVRDGKVTEYQADKMPVGKYSEEMKSFRTQQIKLQKGDIIYTFTDGYADQFGGPKGKKFKYKQLEELLLKNAHLPMEKQKEILDQSFEAWRGTFEQIDDVCVIGVKV